MRSGAARPSSRPSRERGTGSREDRRDRPAAPGLAARPPHADLRRPVPRRRPGAPRRHLRAVHPAARPVRDAGPRAGHDPPAGGAGRPRPDGGGRAGDARDPARLRQGRRRRRTPDAQAARRVPGRGDAVAPSGKGGWVRVTSGTRDGRAVLDVANSGPPVPSYEVPGLFEPFRRLDADRVVTAKGAGLGPSIVQSIVRAHDGEVTARPRPEGGLAVTVTLPAAPP
ncbi:hypothetical protein F8568_009615 [Actinomadura sp. LD22]|uniref:histidine kinase n=1 Tax=Actinomadura physcomitrii TaxID=2650748 RepID=A0A6I4MA08_9ACTN|nr:ATP-binding protein [Actinomadura physcomitrii]MWA00631.1 hypothetical protein [Actinomadura physcomitrii]